MTDASWVTIGFVRKPHGVAGYMKVGSLSDAPDRFKNLKQAWLEFPNGHREAIQVEQTRAMGEHLLIKFEGINTPEQGARLAGAYIQTPMTEVASLPEGEFYVFDLIGCQVVSDKGDEIGRVRDVMTLPANDVFVVDTPRGEVLIPAVRDLIAAIDMQRRSIVVRLIPGLID